jgi:tetratricopeptide (TPR) repeat protein
MMIKELLRSSLLIGFLSFQGFSENATAQSVQSQTSTSAPTGKDRFALEADVAEGMKFMMRDEPGKALPIFQKIITNDPNSSVGNFLVAKALIKQDRLEESLKYALKAFELDKDNEFYGQQLVDLYIHHKQYKQAAEIYEMLLDKDRSNLEYGMNLAMTYLYQDLTDQALKTFDKVEQAIGITEEITRQKQQIYLKQNDLAKAIEAGQKLIASEPTEVLYRLELAEMLIANDRIDDAISPLQESLKINPDEAQAHVLLADIYRRNGDIEKCTAELKKVFGNPNLDAEPKIRVLAGYLSMLKTDVEWKDAAELAKQLVDVHPNELKAIVIYADLQIRSGKKAEARDLYAKAARMKGATYEVWGAVLQLDGELNLLDKMLEDSESALEIFPNQGMIWYSNGTAQLMKQNYKQALSSFEESIKLLSSRPEMIPVIHGQMGDAYNGLKEHGKSDEFYEKSLKDYPDNEHVLNNYSYFLS